MTLPEFHDNWRYLLQKSWAIKWAVLAGVCSGAEIFLPLFVDSMPRLYFAVLALMASVGGIVARLLAQPKDGL
jgi:hypothetical protein